VDLLTIDPDVPGGFDPQADGLPANLGHDHADVTRDDDGLVHLARQH
jgi:hypothetical protein